MERAAVRSQKNVELFSSPWEELQGSSMNVRHKLQALKTDATRGSHHCLVIAFPTEPHWKDNQRARVQMRVNTERMLWSQVLPTPPSSFLTCVPPTYRKSSFPQRLWDHCKETHFWETVCNLALSCRASVAHPETTEQCLSQLTLGVIRPSPAPKDATHEEFLALCRSRFDFFLFPSPFPSHCLLGSDTCSLHRM